MKPAVIVCLLMMAAFLTMVTESDGKPANEFEYEAEPKPMYKKKIQNGAQLDAGLKTGRCCCPGCRRWCTCCCA
ncbi:hypothetical protein ACROYT_G035325 [Oculina patagonica]